MPTRKTKKVFAPVHVHIEEQMPNRISATNDIAPSASATSGVTVKSAKSACTCISCGKGDYSSCQCVSMKDPKMVEGNVKYSLSNISSIKPSQSGLVSSSGSSERIRPARGCTATVISLGRHCFETSTPCGSPSRTKPGPARQSKPFVSKRSSASSPRAVSFNPRHHRSLQDKVSEGTHIKQPVATRSQPKHIPQHVKHDIGSSLRDTQSDDSLMLSKRGSHTKRRGLASRDKSDVSLSKHSSSAITKYSAESLSRVVHLSTSEHSQHSVVTSSSSKEAFGGSPPKENPWIPPPGKTSRGGLAKIRWKSDTHELHIGRPDLSYSQVTNKDDSTASKQHLSVSFVDDESTPRDDSCGEMAERHDSSGAYSEKTFEELQHQLTSTQAENAQLRKSLGQIREEKDLIKYETDPGKFKDTLLNRLLEMESVGETLAKETARIRELLNSVKDEKNLLPEDSALFVSLRNAMLEKLVNFDKTNCILRRLLVDYHDRVTTNERLQEQKDYLSKRVESVEEEKQKLLQQMDDREKSASSTRDDYDLLQAQHGRLQARKDDLESMKAHLQNQLRNKEAEMHRFMVHYRDLEKNLMEQKKECSRLHQQVETFEQKVEGDKRQLLKKMSKAEKSRVGQVEAEKSKLNELVAEKDKKLSEVHNQLEDLKSECDKLAFDKRSLENELAIVKEKLIRLEEEKSVEESKMKHEVESLATDVHVTTSDVASLQLENERLKCSLQTSEQQRTNAENDLLTLRSSVRQLETELQSQKELTNASRREVEEKDIELAHLEKERGRLKQLAVEEVELEKSRSRSHLKIEEPEPLSDLLHVAQDKLHASQARFETLNQQYQDQSKELIKLQINAEKLTQQLQFAAEKQKLAEDMHQSSRAQLETLQAKLADVGSESKDARNELGQWQRTARDLQATLETKSNDNASMALRLESALAEARKANEHAQEKSSGKERILQKRIADLEAEVGRSKAECLTLKSAKDEIERKLVERLSELQDKYDMLNSNSKGMNNYINFLRSSYASVFQDPVITSTPLKARQTSPSRSKLL